MIELLPIWQTNEENLKFADKPICRNVIVATMDYYKTIGFTSPWIGYLATLNGQLVGSAGYKGKPVDNKIEIAYGTFPEFQHQGIGTQICRQLVQLAIMTDSQLKITARTLPDNLYSIAILKKNGFELLGIVHDKDDGDVQEWLHYKHSTQRHL